MGTCRLSRYTAWLWWKGVNGCSVAEEYAEGKRAANAMVIGT